ncbi:Antitoxin igA-2 (fragment) [Crenothrix polyspora]|uniref:Antitoxin igA-2 n=1 Tax=Crenothrix polyspora TaxID=360316 RepID=A0A1R4HB12_9GAMM
MATLRDWEQGRFVPPGGVLCLLKIIYNHPDLISELDAA